MPTINARVNVGDIMEALDIVDLPDSCRLKGIDDFRMEVEVSQSEIDDNATVEDPEPELVPVEAQDIREGLQAILVGDIAMGRTLLLRALEHDADACRVIEEELR